MKTFEKEREEVRAFINSRQFELGKEKCLSVLKFMDVNDIKNNYDKWFFNLRLGICYRRLNKINKALYYIHQSSLYSQNQEEIIESWWMIGVCKDKQNNIKGALKFYNKCLEYYEQNNMMINKAYILFNIARLCKNENTIKEVLDLYMQYDAPQYEIDNAYEALFEIYINNKDIKKAEEIISYIVDENIKQKLFEKCQVLKCLHLNKTNLNETKGGI